MMRSVSQIAAAALWLSVVCIPAARLEAQARFMRTYGGSDEDSGYAVCPLPDSGYLIAGWTESFGAGGADVWLIRTDAAGETLWTRTCGDAHNQRAYDIAPLAGGDFIVAGETDANDSGDFYIVRVNLHGDILWARSFGSPGFDGGRSIRQTMDLGLAAAGFTSSMGKDVYHLRLDSAGREAWGHTIGGWSEDEGRCLRQTADGGYVIIGCFGEVGDLADHDVYLIRTDSGSIEELPHFYGEAGADEAGNAVAETPDSGYIIAAQCGRGPWAIRANRQGDVVWDWKDRSIGSLNSVCLLPDGGSIFAGDEGSGPRLARLLHLDSSGHLVWERTYASGDDCSARGVARCADGGYVIVGSACAEGNPADVCLIKTDSAGFVGLAEQSTRREAAGFLDCPSLVRRACPVLIRCRTPVPGPAAVAVYNALGRKVWAQRTWGSAAEQVLSLDAQTLGLGSYFVCLRSSGLVVTKRVVVVK